MASDDLARLRAMVEAGWRPPVYEELLAVAEAAMGAVWEQTESDSAHRAHQALGAALDALRAKLREVV